MSGRCHDIGPLYLRLELSADGPIDSPLQFPNVVSSAGEEQTKSHAVLIRSPGDGPSLVAQRLAVRSRNSVQRNPVAFDRWTGPDLRSRIAQCSHHRWQW